MTEPVEIKLEHCGCSKSESVSSQLNSEIKIEAQNLFELLLFKLANRSLLLLEKRPARC